MKTPTQVLTKRQLQVLKFIVNTIRERYAPPTIRELGAHLGITSTNGISDHLRALDRKGYLTRVKGHSRGMLVNWEAAQALGLAYPVWVIPGEKDQIAITTREMQRAELAAKARAEYGVSASF